MRFPPVLVSTFLACTAALAASPHFLSASGTVNDEGALVVNFKEVGLGDTTQVNYLLSTSASATYQCFNGGNNVPQGNPYTIDDQPLTATGTFHSGKNGNIVASLTAGPPDPAPAEAVLKCVSTSKKLCLMYISYSGTTLTDTTFNLSIGVTPNPTERSFAAPTKKSPAPDNCFTSL